MKTMPWQSLVLALALALATACAASVARAATTAPGPPLAIQKAAGPIVLDGDLTDAGWQGVTPITQWWETRVGDNVPPPVGNVAYLAYDSRYLYAAFRFDDPNPRLIRAPIADHDALSGLTDYGGIIVDSHDDGKTAVMFLANANGLQYDAVTNDATGEDNSPDFFWESAGRITESGWNLELRVPFSSLRYADANPSQWRILLYRNYPRDRHYQFFSARMPRDVNCFVCNSSALTGLASLPRGSHLVAAPYLSESRSDAPSGDLGSPLANGERKEEYGLDVKWSPIANLALDATLNPDFSQVESDAAQIVANERFALFFPEKRSFFLEGVDLFSTPLQAVYTRTITDPEEGLRATGRVGATAYTALVAHDLGGGSVILPGPQGSGDALQDFHSTVGIVRMRHDLGRSFVSLLGTTREIENGGFNRVVGPDFQWRPRRADTFTGQALVSDTRTPDRPDLAAEWDGRKLTDRALLLRWEHSDGKIDWFVQGQDLGEKFRTDDGFIPQVGYREVYLDGGYTMRPKDRFLSRVRLFTTHWVDVDEGGDVLSQRVSVGSGMDGRWSSFLRVELNGDAFRVGDQLLRRFRPTVHLEASPNRTWNSVTLESSFGEEVDFANARTGHGVSLSASTTVRPGAHLDLQGSVNRRWLDVPVSGSSRLFTAEVERVRVTYNFTSRSFARLIGQHVRTTRDPALYGFAVDARDADFAGSALFAYKLNWQTVLYAGYGDQRTWSPVTDRFEKRGRQLFAKISYALQM